MTSAMNTPTSVSRARWLRIAGATWLLLVSAVAIVNSVALSRLSESVESSAQDAQVQALATHMVDLDRQIAEERNKPPVLGEARFETAHQALQERLASIEQAQAGSVGADEMHSIRSRVEQIEARLDKLRQAPVAAAASARPQIHPPSKPKVAGPPFTAVGVELRGNERFLSLAPEGVTSLDQVRLLRVGESEAGWRLEAIEAGAAVLRLGDQLQRIELP